MEWRLFNPFPAEILEFKVATLRGNPEPLNLLKHLAFPHSAFQDKQNEWSHYRVLTTGSKVEMFLVYLKSGLA